MRLPEPTLIPLAGLVSKDLVRRPVWWVLVTVYAASVIWSMVAVPLSKGMAHGNRPLTWLRYLAYATLWLELGMSTTGYRHPLEIRETGWVGRWRLAWQATLSVLAGSVAWTLIMFCNPRRFHVEPGLLLAALFTAIATTTAATLPCVRQTHHRVALVLAAAGQELALLRSAGTVLENSALFLLLAVSTAWLLDAVRRA